MSAVAAKSGVPKGTVKAVVDAVFGENGVVAGELRHGGEVRVQGFGSLTVALRAGRTTRLPGQEPVTTAARKVVKFRAGKHLAEVVAR